MRSLSRQIKGSSVYNGHMVPSYRHVARGVQQPKRGCKQLSDVSHLHATLGRSNAQTLTPVRAAFVFMAVESGLSTYGGSERDM